MNAGVRSDSSGGARPEDRLLDTVREVIDARMQEYVRDLGADPAGIRASPAHHSVHSVLFPFDVETGHRREGVVAKMHLGPSPLTSAEREFRNLTILYDHFQAYSEWRVPRPIDWLPDLGIVLMERFYAPRLDRQIRMLASRFRRGTAALELQCRRSGEWLCRLLEWQGGLSGTVGQVREQYRAEWNHELAGILKRVEATNLPRRLLETVRGLMEQGGARDTVCRLHSDFAPYNVHGDDHALYVVDFSEMPLGVGEQCAGFFWASLELTKLHPLLSSTGLIRCQQAFETGYGHPISLYWRIWGMLRHLSYGHSQAAAQGLRLTLWRRWRNSRAGSRLKEMVSRA